MDKLLLGIDLGTSGCKLTFFNLEGEVVASKTAEYSTFYGENNVVEHDADDWWSVVCKSINEMLVEKNINNENVAGIGIDGLSWTCLPVDINGNPLRKAMIWLDRRAKEETEWMRETCGERNLIKLSGNPVDASYIAPKILWMQKNEPELYEKTHKFLQSNAYIVLKLTGEFTQDYSQAYGFHFFDMINGKYDEKIAKQLNIPLEKIAPLKQCHEIVGKVTEKAAQLTGLKVGTPVVAGGLDAACCTLGAGVINPGETQEQGGQAGGMSIALDRPLIHPKLILGYHVLPDMWLLQGGTVGGAGTLNWFNRHFGEAEQMLGRKENMSPFEVMSDEASEINEGSNGLLFLPYMAGERSPIWDSDARGVFFGLDYKKSRKHVIRSIMEGVGYSLQHNLHTAEEVGAYVDKLVSVGGSSNSEVWTQIKADITGKTIDVPNSDYATTLGAAILAGIGVGVYDSFEDAVKKTVKVKRRHTPNDLNTKKYSGYYDIYLELYGNLKSSFKRLSTMG